MKWFDRWFYRKARWCWKRANQIYPELKFEQDMLDEIHDRQFRNNGNEVLVCESSTSSISGDGLRIDIKSVVGGNIVTIRHPAKESNTHYEEPRCVSYIVTDNEDFNQRLGELITLEMLKRG